MVRVLVIRVSRDSRSREERRHGRRRGRLEARLEAHESRGESGGLEKRATGCGKGSYN